MVPRLPEGMQLRAEIQGALLTLISSTGGGEMSIQYEGMGK